MQSGSYKEHAVQLCTQRCLLGLQQDGPLDENYPNVKLHRQGRRGCRHCIDTGTLVQLLQQQLDEDLDHNCTPFGARGSYGAPFKITCAAYGYTVVRKGTTSQLWKEVSHEAEIYQVLKRAQGSAVPVFLGAIDLTNIYFLHGAGEMRHMLLMAWGGDSATNRKKGTVYRREKFRSIQEIRSLGIIHQDLRSDNIIWNIELNPALVIDFHRAELDRRLISNRVKSRERPLCGMETRTPK